MATVTVTANLKSVGGVPDNTVFSFRSPTPRLGADGSIVTAKWTRVAPVNGILTAELEPGPCVVSWTGSSPLNIVIPETDSDLWALIAVAIGVPPGTPQQTLIDAVVDYLSSNASPMGAQLITAASQAAARDVIDAIDPKTVNIITSGVNVERESTGIDWSDGAEVRAAVQGIVNQAAADNQRVRFPNREYLLGKAGVTGANRILIPTGAKWEFDPEAHLVVNQVDSQANKIIVAAEGTESTKISLTTNCVAGDRVITLPSGQGANFQRGDLIALESRAIVTPTTAGVTAVGQARQIFMVEYVTGDVIRPDRPLADSFLTTDGAVFSKITPARDIVIDGLKFLSGPGVTLGTDYARLLRLSRTLNARLGNIELHNAIGGVYLHDAFDTRIDGIYGNTIPRKSDGYVCAVEGASFNWTIENLVGRECRHLFTTLFDSRNNGNGTVAAATSTTITLGAAASSVNNFYLGNTINVLGPGGSPSQFRIITGYVGATKVATVDVAWTTTPTTSHTYGLYSAYGNPEHGTIISPKGFGGLGATSLMDTHEAGRDIFIIGGDMSGGATTTEPTIPADLNSAQSGYQIRSSDTHLIDCHAKYAGREGVVFASSSRNCTLDGGTFSYSRGNGVNVQGSGHILKNFETHHNIGGPGVYVDSNSVDITLEDFRSFNNRYYGMNDFGSTRTRVVRGTFLKEAPGRAEAQVFSINGLSATSRAEGLICLGFGANATGMTATVSGALYSVTTDSGGVQTNMASTINSNTVETQNNKNAASGYAGLDSGSKIAVAQLGLTADDQILQRKSGALAARTPAQLKADLAISSAEVGALSTVSSYISAHWYPCGLTGQTTTAIPTLNRIIYQPWLVKKAMTVGQLMAEFTIAGSADSYVRLGVYLDTGAGKPGALLAEVGTISTGTGNAGAVATGGTPGAYAITSLTLAVPVGLVWVASKTEGTTAATMRCPSTAAQIPPDMEFGTATPVAGQQTGVWFEAGTAGASLPATATPAGTNTPQGARTLFKVA